MINIRVTCDDPNTQQHLDAAREHMHQAQHAAGEHVRQALRHVLQAGISALDAHAQCKGPAAQTPKA